MDSVKDQSRRSFDEGDWRSRGKNLQQLRWFNGIREKIEGKVEESKGEAKATGKWALRWEVRPNIAVERIKIHRVRCQHWITQRFYLFI